MTLGDLLRRLRAERSMTQVQLAEQAGLSTKHVASMERGAARPSRATALSLARALQLEGEQRDALLDRAGYPVDVEVTDETWIDRYVALETAHGVFVFDNEGKLLAANARALALLDAVTAPAAHPLDRPFTDAVLWRAIRARVVDFGSLALRVVARAAREHAMRRRGLASFELLREAVGLAAEIGLGSPGEFPAIALQARLDPGLVDITLLFTTPSEPTVTALESPTIVTVLPNDDASARILDGLPQR